MVNFKKKYAVRVLTTQYIQDSHGHGWRKGKWALSLSQDTACWGLPASSLLEGCSLPSQAFWVGEHFCSQVYPEFKGVSHFLAAHELLLGGTHFISCSPLCVWDLRQKGGVLR